MKLADDRLGIANQDKPKALKHIYRDDASRSTPDVGPYLNLADTVNRLHGGSADNHPRLRAIPTLLRAPR